ncbi:MAG: DUF3105 domain-containing protein [Anaerolineales bacterium]|nr:DUF3105 domain-containing protein [Anaerolineales bacterium]
MTTARARNAQQRSEWEQREKRRRRLIIGGWIGVAVVFVGLLAYLVWQETIPDPRPGDVITIQGAEHISVGQPHDPYNSDPPTSGPHYEQPAEAGFYDEAPPDEQLVHNMEHGHVIIWYDCSALVEADCAQLKAQIRDVMGRAGVSTVTGTLKLVAAPRTGMETHITLTSWGHLYRLKAFDAEAILEFIRAYRDEAPEPGAA